MKLVRQEMLAAVLCDWLAIQAGFLLLFQGEGMLWKDNIVWR